MLPHSERMTTHEKDGVVYYTFPAFDARPLSVTAFPPGWAA